METLVVGPARCIQPALGQHAVADDLGGDLLALLLGSAGTSTVTATAIAGFFLCGTGIGGPPQPGGRSATGRHPERQDFTARAARP